MTTLTLPSRDEAIKLLASDDLTALSRDGWAHLEMDHPGLAELFKELAAMEKINLDNVTGAAMLIGLALTQKPRSR